MLSRQEAIGLPKILKLTPDLIRWEATERP
jgi:hypothetical protein